MLALLIIIASAWLDRVRGGGFGGDKRPGRAVFWVARPRDVELPFYERLVAGQCG